MDIVHEVFLESINLFAEGVDPVLLQNLYRLFSPVHAQNNYGLPGFPPAQIWIKVMDIYTGPLQGLEYCLKTAGMVGDLYRYHVGFLYGITMAS